MSKKQSIWSEERHLVEGLKSQNREAYDWLYTQYSGALYALIRRLITDEEIANDALQDCFIKIWKQIEQYDSTKGKLYTWMFNLCRNHCIDVIRSKNFKNQKENQRLEEVS
ncbi:RNA polymerase sigma factor, partial [Umezakia ovalisporum]|uniref:RNA polymerase sigma factor n=1 Tax=Umezakia ovalisporum TaxID=75695 RepID=UPI0039C69FEB